MSDAKTPQQMDAQQAMRNNNLLLRVVNAITQDERVSAARELRLMPPAHVQPAQTRVVMRMVRTEDGKWWAGIEGAEGVISQVILDDLQQMLTVLEGCASLVCSPLMTDEEHATVNPHR